MRKQRSQKPRKPIEYLEAASVGGLFDSRDLRF
jgi:hypothetical protein